MGLLGSIGIGKLTATLAIGAAIVSIGLWYLGTLDDLLRTDGEATVQPAPLPPIPAPMQAPAHQIAQGYEDAYFGPVEQIGDQVADPAAADPTVTVPDVPLASAPG